MSHNKRVAGRKVPTADEMYRRSAGRKKRLRIPSTFSDWTGLLAMLWGDLYISNALLHSVFISNSRAITATVLLARVSGSVRLNNTADTGYGHQIVFD